MWPYALAAAAVCWLFCNREEPDGQWYWCEEEGAWAWRWGGRLWLWLEVLPWVRYSEDNVDWPLEDRGAAAAMWWSFAMGSPRSRFGGGARARQSDAPADRHGAALGSETSRGPP